MPDRRNPPKVAERLARMLVIVPYLVRHPGTRMREISDLFDVNEGELRKDLDLLFMSGLPPYSPGDLIEVDVDEEDRVWISMADHFSRPLRLTRQEALAILVRATELLATPGAPQAPELASALAKLRETLGPVEGIEKTSPRPAPVFLDAVRKASEELERIRLDYVAASTGERAWRTVDPEVVFAAAGNWYLVGWEAEADAERMFRVDRIVAVEGTGETFEPRGLQGAGRPLYSPSQGDVPVRLLLGPSARWAAEYYATTDVIERENGWLEVALPASNTGWVAGLVLRLGPEAKVLEPASLADEVKDLAARTLALYGC